MIYDLPSNFYDTLDQKYHVAVENDDIKFNGGSAISKLEQQKIGDSTFNYQITLLSSLMHRPEKGSKETNPFEKPEKELTILDSFGPDDEFKVVFNKFPVVPRHFMMITREFKSQDTPLSPSELIGTYTLLNRVKNDSKENWFAFYNSGPQSGASQPHKHVQFMTLPDGFKAYGEQLAQTSAPFIPNQKNEPLQNKDLPFAHFAAPLPPNELDLQHEDLTMYFVSLLQRCLTVLKQNGAKDISYSFIMTTDYMMLVPRSNGVYKNTIGVNSCGYVGLFLCKNEETQSLVNSDGPFKILESCGFPNTAGEPVDEYHY